MIRLADFKKYAAASLCAGLRDEFSQQTSASASASKGFGHNDIFQLPISINSARYKECKNFRNSLASLQERFSVIFNHPCQAVKTLRTFRVRERALIQFLGPMRG